MNAGVGHIWLPNDDFVVSNNGNSVKRIISYATDVLGVLFLVFLAITIVLGLLRSHLLEISMGITFFCLILGLGCGALIGQDCPSCQSQKFRAGILLSRRLVDHEIMNAYVCKFCGRKWELSGGTAPLE